MVPYRDNGRLTQAQKQFNRRLSSCRIVVEHAFGIMKQRFRQLYHCKLHNLERCVTFIHACCVLHNIASDDDLQYFDPAPADELPQPTNNSITHQLLDEVFGNQSDIAGTALRDELCRQFSTQDHVNNDL